MAPGPVPAGRHYDVARARRPRRSIRLRLTVLYVALSVASGAALLTVTYLLVTHLPPIVDVRIGSDGSGAGSSPPSLPPFADVAARQRSADQKDLLIRSGFALVAMTIVAIGLGWLIAGRVLAPLRTITEAARRISASSLHERLALAGPDDELKALGDTFDALLARLECAFTSQRQFVANASHELRTPLTLERALLEAALTDPDPTPQSWRTACERAVAANMQQEHLIEALLTLARGEGGLDRLEPVDLTALADGLVGARHADAERANIGFTTTFDPADVCGDPRLLERLVANLIDNAVRHNTAGGRVEVRTGAVSGRPTLSVGNSGPSVPPGEVERLFQPFQRMSEARHHVGGLGLGLSIVRAVATAHGAHVTAEPRPGGGLDVTVSFPIAASVLPE